MQYDNTLEQFERTNVSASLFNAVAFLQADMSIPSYYNDALVEHLEISYARVPLLYPAVEHIAV